MPTPDVLPSGVRRRLSLRDALLPAVLSAELLAGVVLGGAWERREDVLTALSLDPAPAVAVPASASEPAAVVVVPPVPPPPPPPPPPLRTVPHNPFAVLVP